MTEYEENMKKSIIQSLLYSQIVFLILLPMWIKLTLYLHPLVIVVVWFSLFLFVLFCVFLVKREKISVSNHVLHTLTFFYSVGLLILLFFRPSNQNYSDYKSYSFKHHSFLSIWNS